MNGTMPRTRALTLAGTALLLSVGLFFSPRLVERVYAQEPSVCNVNCKLGSCSGTGTCTCSCSVWTGSPICSCQTSGGGGGGGGGGDGPGENMT